MSGIDWAKYDATVDHEGLQKDYEEAQNNGGEFKEVPPGEYEVKIVKLELTQSKKGDAMGLCWFEVLEGAYKKQKIFYYQVVDSGFKINIFNKLLRSLESGVDVKWKNNYGKYAEDIKQVFSEIERKGLEYALKYGETDKGFKTYEITEVFDD